MDNRNLDENMAQYQALVDDIISALREIDQKIIDARDKIRREMIHNPLNASNELCELSIKLYNTHIALIHNFNIRQDIINQNINIGVNNDER